MLSKNEKVFLGNFSILGRPVNPVVCRFAIGYLVASILDVLLTRWALDLGLSELNPLHHFLGFSGFMMAKLGVATLITGLMVWKNKIKLAIWALAVMVIVCAWNLCQILAVI